MADAAGAYPAYKTSLSSTFLTKYLKLGLIKHLNKASIHFKQHVWSQRRNLLYRGSTTQLSIRQAYMSAQSYSKKNGLYSIIWHIILDYNDKLTNL